MVRLLNAASGAALTFALLAAGPAAAADAAHGRSVFEGECSSCHSVKKGQTVLGPSLFGIVGRTSGSMPGFAYSKAMKATNWTWTDARLRAYIAAPKVAVPGDKMAYGGLRNPGRLDDLMAYLDTLR